MSNSGEGPKGVDDIVGRPEVLAAAEAQLRAASGREATTHEILSKILGAGPRDVAREVAATLWKPLAATILAVGVAACVTDIDSKPPVDRGAASASANPGPSGSAGAGGEPPDPDQWGKMEGALYGNPDFTLTTPATNPAFDQPATEYWDTGQCEVAGLQYTIFPIYTESTYNLQFAAGTSQNPEEAMSSPTADFIDGLEEYGEIYNIACYKDTIIISTSGGGLQMATLGTKGDDVFGYDGIKATNIVELPFLSDEITILVDNGVPYLYYGEGSVGRFPLDILATLTAEMSDAEKSSIINPYGEAVPELDGMGNTAPLPTWIIPPDPTTGEGLIFGNRGTKSSASDLYPGDSLVMAAKTLAGLAASNAVVKELNGNPPAYFTGNVTATPVYDEKGNLIKVYVTFVRQQTEFGKRKLHYVIFSLAPKIDPPPDTDPVPDTDEADAGNMDDVPPTDDAAVTDDVPPTDDVAPIEDTEEPWELQEEDVPEEVEEDVPATEPDDGVDPIDPGPKPTDSGLQDVEPTEDKGPTDDPDIENPDIENPPTQKLFTFKPGPEYGNCNATVKLLEPEEAKKYDIQIAGTGTEEKPCLAEVQIEGSENIMLYMFWNDANGEVKQKCVIVDDEGAAKPICEILAVNNYYDVEEDGEGTEGKVLGTVTGSSASAWTLGWKQGLDEEGNLIDLAVARNNEEGTTVLMKLNDTTILTLIETGVWHEVNAATGEEVFPKIPNPPEGAESLPIPWELQPEAQQGDLATTQPTGGSDPGCTAGAIGRRIGQITNEKPAETPSSLGTFLILLATFATMAASRLRRKKQAS